MATDSERRIASLSRRPRQVPVIARSASTYIGPWRRWMQGIRHGRSRFARRWCGWRAQPRKSVRDCRDVVAGSRPWIGTPGGVGERERAGFWLGRYGRGSKRPGRSVVEAPGAQDNRRRVGGLIVIAACEDPARGEAPLLQGPALAGLPRKAVTKWTHRTRR